MAVRTQPPDQRRFSRVGWLPKAQEERHGGFPVPWQGLGKRSGQSVCRAGSQAIWDLLLASPELLDKVLGCSSDLFPYA